MRPATAAFRHDMIVFDSDDEFLSRAVSFVTEGLAVGEQVAVAVRDDREAAVRAEFGAFADVEVTVIDRTTRPAALLRQRRERLARIVTASATPAVRVLTEVPHSGVGAYGDEWLRYEAAAGQVFRGVPAWGVCAYDAQLTPSTTIEALRRFHTSGPMPTAVDGAGDHAAWLFDRDAVVTPDPLERRRGEVLVDPTPSDVRAAVRAAALGEIGVEATEDLRLAVSEIVTNAHEHGRGPVQVRLVVGDGRAIVLVHDRGSGPSDPLAGLLPLVIHEAHHPAADGSGRGLGLWLASQLVHVSHWRDQDGYSVRLSTAPPGDTGGR